MIINGGVIMKTTVHDSIACQCSSFYIQPGLVTWLLIAPFVSQLLALRALNVPSPGTDIPLLMIHEQGDLSSFDRVRPLPKYFKEYLRSIRKKD